MFERPDVIARWLAQDVSGWATNQLWNNTMEAPMKELWACLKTEADESINAGWHLKYETLTTTPNTINLSGEHTVGGVNPLKVPKSKVIKNGMQNGLTLQTAAMARIMSERGTSIAVANNTNWVWNMSSKICETMQAIKSIPDEILLVQNFLRAEISTNFELIDMLLAWCRSSSLRPVRRS
jgi:hypothetical protein